jgi:hypothetical protein
MANASGSSIVIGQDELRSFSSFEIREDILNLHEFSLVCPRSALAALSSGNSQGGLNVSEKIGSPITFSVTGIETHRGKPKDFHYKGIITGICAYRDEINSLQELVRITGSGSDILLEDIPTCRCFEEMSVNEIVDQILMSYPQDLISKTGSHRDSTRYPYIVQYNETTLEFFRRLFGIFGEWFYYDGKNLVCGPVKKTEETGVYGINISNVEVSSSISPLNFRTKYHDVVHDTTTTGDSANVSLDSFVGKAGKNALNHSGSLYPQSRESFLPFINTLNAQPDPINDRISVQKKLLATALVRISGNCLTPLHAGYVLNVFSHHKSNLDPSTVDLGGYMITKVVHQFTDNEKNYYNTFEGIPSEMDILPRRQEINKPYCPVQNAVITDNNDPEHLGRVKVHFDWMEDGQSTPWISTINPHSGDNRGFYFIPETGDEVVVGFEQNHPQKPYVMGTMFAGNNAPGQGWGTSKNDIKKIRTRQGNTIEFDDTNGSEKLNIYNGNGNSADSANNKILLTLSPNKITIESDGDIEIKGKNLDIHADSDISIQSDSGNISLKGSQVSIEAQGAFKAKGATAEVDGSGEVTIKGGIVQIN